MSRRRIHFVLLLALLCLAWLVRMRGVDWPRFHPDESTIAQWIEESEADGVVRHYGYPSGFFNLFHPVLRAVTASQLAQHRWQMWRGAQDRLPEPRQDLVRLARLFNVGAGVLTVLFLYGLARRVTASRSAALFAAALLAFLPFHVEHGHYAETDMAMLAMLTLAAWLNAVALARGGPGWLAAAGAATGVAVGTKYTIALFAFVPLLTAILAPGRRTKGGLAVTLCATLLPLAAGFLWANPGVTEWASFEAGLREGARRTFAERVDLLGEQRHTWWIPPLVNARGGAHAAAALGAVWLLFAAAGAALALRAPFRRFAPLLLAFPILFSLYFVFVSPWVRTQEFMPLVPFLAVLAALPVAAALRAAPGAQRTVACTAVLALACAALADGAIRTWRTTTLFQWREPRLVARDWLQRHAPADARLGFERYAQFAVYGHPAPLADLGKIEWSDPARIQGTGGCAYVLRNASSWGRGTLDPRTGRRREEYQRNFEAFLADADPLAAWGPLPPHLSMFVGARLELHGVGREPVATNLALALTRPAYLDPSARVTWNHTHLPLGSETAVQVDRRGRRLALGGPAPHREPVYVVLSTEDRAARIRVSGLGRRRTVQLGPYDVAVVALQRPWWLPAWDSYTFVHLRALNDPSVLYLPCFARIARDAADVVRLCNELGRPDRALAFLASDASPGSPGLQGFIAAVEAGRADRAAAWANAARAEYNALDAVRAGTSAAVDGVTPLRYRDFARLRFAADYLPDITVAVRDPKRDPRAEDVDWRREMSSIDAVQLPVLLAAGRYELHLHMRATQPTNLEAAAEGEYAIEDLFGRTLLRGNWRDVAQRTPVVVPLTARHAIQPCLKFRSDAPARVQLSGLELRWQRSDLLGALRSRATDALAAHALSEGRADEALRLLDGDPVTAWNEASRRALRFRAASAASVPDFDAVREQAKALLEVAPAHFEARSLLEATERARLYSTRHRETGDHPFVAVPPFARLVNVAATNGTLRCTVEFTRDETPPLAVALAQSRKARWKEIAVKPLGTRRWSSAGERLTVALPLPEGRATDGLAVGLRTQMRWRPGWLPAEGYPEGRVPLPALRAPASPGESGSR